MHNKERKIKGRGHIILLCPVCSKEFKLALAHYRGATNCCSVECSRKARPVRKQVMLDHVCKECGKLFETRLGRGGTGDYCSISCRSIACGRNHSGPSHSNWKGGISERTSTTRTVIADRVRVEGKCEECGSTNHLQGHHVKMHSVDKEGRANPANIQVLCIPCHALKHPKYSAMILAGLARY